MGANLCSLLRAKNHSNDPQFDSKTSCIELLKPDCLKTQKRKQLHQQENKFTKVAKVTTRVKTLEDWMLASPAVRRDGNGSNINASAIQDPKQCNYRVCSWMSSTPTPYVEISGDFSLARDSLSLERRKKVEETSLERMETSKSQSGKVIKKRVSFRLPEEADIIIYYSPEIVVGD